MTETQLVINDISKTYGDVTALDHISLSLEPGIYGLVGNNGAGKSTMLNILTTVIRPDSGRVLYKGRTIDKNKRYRKNLGYVPQLLELPKHISCEQYLYYIASLKRLDQRAADEKIQYLLERLSLQEKRHEAASDLSGGQRQRLLIAQSLLNDPEVLLMDEPTAGLDPIERTKLREFIVEISPNKIIVLATHIISDIEYIADRVVLLEKGHLLACKSQEQLISSVTVFETLMSHEQYHQFKEEHCVINTALIGDQVLVRHFDAETGGSRVNTKLEDVYLHELSSW